MPTLEQPADLDLDDLRNLLSAAWPIEPAVLQRLRVGGDSWNFRTGEWFINVRDGRGQRHPWQASHDVEPAFDAAIALHDEAGLDFLLAPTPTTTGRSLARLGRFAVTAMLYLDGAVHYRPYTRSELARSAAWIARLHAAPVRRFGSGLPVEDFSVRCADVLRAALGRAAKAEVGPYSAALGAVVRRHAAKVLADLAEQEAAAHRLRYREHELVITHGEPFPGNVFHSSEDRAYLIDLSEFRIAPKPPWPDRSRSTHPSRPGPDRQVSSAYCPVPDRPADTPTRRGYPRSVPQGRECRPKGQSVTHCSFPGPQQDRAPGRTYREPGGIVRRERRDLCGPICNLPTRRGYGLPHGEGAVAAGSRTAAGRSGSP